MTTGFVLQAASQLVFLCGTDAVNFYGGLVLLGVGWNCAFISGTMLLLESHTENERVRVTSANETLRFTANACGILMSSSFSWRFLNNMCLLVLLSVVPVMVSVRASLRRS